MTSCESVASEASHSVPFFALAGQGREQGVGATRSGGSDADELLAVAHAHGVTAAQVRPAWTLHQDSHVLAIPGTGNPGHLTENAAAGALRLSADEVARLDSHHTGAA